MKGCIYKLVCNCGYYYFGSTINGLYGSNGRLSTHNNDLKKINKAHKYNKLYKHIVERHDNIYDFESVILEEKEYEDIKHIKLNEDKYIYECLNDEYNLNVRLNYALDERRKEYMKKYNDNYYKNNKDKISASYQKYKELLYKCDICGKTIKRVSQYRHKIKCVQV
jgi:hypothetical protein